MFFGRITKKWIKTQIPWYRTSQCLCNPFAMMRMSWLFLSLSLGPCLWHFSQEKWPADLHSFGASVPFCPRSVPVPFPLQAKDGVGLQKIMHRAPLCFCSLYFLYIHSREKDSPHLATAAGATRESQLFPCIFPVLYERRKTTSYRVFFRLAWSCQGEELLHEQKPHLASKVFGLRRAGETGRALGENINLSRYLGLFFMSFPGHSGNHGWRWGY